MDDYHYTTPNLWLAAKKTVNEQVVSKGVPSCFI